jgi:hypothetical protein
LGEGRCGLFSDLALLLEAGVFFLEALQFFIQMFVLDLPLLTLGMVIFPEPGVERIFIDTKITGYLGNGLIRLDSQFHCPFLKRSSWMPGAYAPP